MPGSRPRRELSARPIALMAVLLGLVAGLFSSGLTSVAVATTPALPSVTSITPATGPAAGGNTVQLTGGPNLDLARGVWFGEVPATSFARSGNAVTATVPAGLSGTTVFVSFYGPTLSSPAPSAPHAYTYAGRTRKPVSLAPDHGLPAGGNTVVVTGDGIDFSTATKVTFGEETAAIVNKTATSVSVIAPAALPTDQVRVAVTLADGHVEGLQQNRYTYDLSPEPPVVTGVSPDRMYENAFGEIVLSGRGLEGTTDVSIDGRPLTFYRQGRSLRVYAPADRAPGTYDVVVTTPSGTSANTSADDFTVVALPPLPVIESISPDRGSQWGGTRVTVRGRNFGLVSYIALNHAAEVRDVSISENEIQFVTGETYFPGPTQLYLTNPAGSVFSEPGIEFTYFEDPDVVPSVQTISPASGPVSGGTTVVLKGQDLDLVTKVYFGGNEATGVTAVSSSELRVTVPAGDEPGEVGIGLFFPFRGGPGSTSAADSYTYTAVPTPTPTPTPQVSSYDYGVKGTATLKTLTSGSLPLQGGIATKLNEASGAFEGALKLAPSSGKLVALGFLPVVAKVDLIAMETVAGTLKGGKLSATAKVRIKLPSVKTLGIELAGGANCQAKQISSIALASTQPTFTPAAGGPIAGTFAISDLTGCGFLTGLVSPLTKGGGNAIALNLTR